MKYTVLKKGLHNLRGYSTRLNEKKIPSKHTRMSRNIGDVSVTFTGDILCGFHAFQHHFQLFVT
jgi:hypothetical protein